MSGRGINKQWVLIGAFAFFLWGGKLLSLELVAHRGLHQIYNLGSFSRVKCKADRIEDAGHSFIENTLSSIRAAFDMGASVVEIDIRRTQDQQLVLFHDENLGCKTDGNGRVRDRTLQEIKKFDAGYYYTFNGGKTYPLRGLGVGKIPTFEEVLLEFPEGRFLIDHKDKDLETTKLLI